MGLKPDKCYEKAAPDEPVFVLRAQDVLAPSVIRFWADMAGVRGVARAKIEEAYALANQMEQYRFRKVPD
jgi:hypothetical protein